MVAEIPPETRMGAVHLSVSDLGRSIAYYESAIGLRVHSSDGDRAALGTGGDDLLVLTAQPGARPATGLCGLFHFALLVPERTDLARFLLHAASEKVALTGLSDHFVSEAIYLRDPDAHGIEIYWDRPRELWEGQVGQRLTTLPLDTRDLVRGVDAATFDGLAGGTVMGHVHLRVANVPATTAFYAGALGFGVMAAMGDQATFLSAGGYHHHVGGNTWESAGRPPAPAGTARLERATIVLPDAAARDRLAEQAERAGFVPEPLEDGGVGLRDPSGNPIALVAQRP
jgi:catechol 2,3-dioxygenase